VLADSVRLFELLLVFLGGMAAYVACVMPFRGFSWTYVAASGSIAVAMMIAFQVADIYQVQHSAATRGNTSVDVGMVRLYSWCLMGIKLSIGIGDDSLGLAPVAYSLLGPRRSPRISQDSVLLVRSWTRAGRLERRTQSLAPTPMGENLVHSLNEQNDSDLRINGMFDDRGDERAPASKTSSSGPSTIWSRSRGAHASTL